MPGVGKKADAVADRSSVPLLYNLACLHQGSPARRGNRNGFPESQVFGAGTLPVGVQGRSALLAAISSEIPDWVMIIAENRGNGRFRAFLLEYGNGRG